MNTLRVYVSVYSLGDAQLSFWPLKSTCGPTGHTLVLTCQTHFLHVTDCSANASEVPAWWSRFCCRISVFALRKFRQGCGKPAGNLIHVASVCWNLSSSQVIRALDFVTLMKSGPSAALLTDHGRVASVLHFYIHTSHTAISESYFCVMPLSSSSFSELSDNEAGAINVYTQQSGSSLLFAAYCLMCPLCPFLYFP